MLTTALLLVALLPAQLTAEKPLQPAPKPATQPPAEKPATKPVAPAAPRPAAPRPTSITFLVTDRQGKPIPGALVKASGPMDREGTTDGEGTVLLRNVGAGTYRMRFEHASFITFERELTVQAGRPANATAELSPAPPPPVPPPAPEPPPAPAAPAASAPRPSGPATSVDIPDVAEKSSKSAQVGCTGTSTSTLVQLRDPLPLHAHEDGDELIYVVAGAGTQRIGGVDTNLAPATFAVVPRGTQHSISRRGSRPLIMLSIITGPPCEPTK